METPGSYGQHLACLSASCTHPHGGTCWLLGRGTTACKCPLAAQEGPWCHTKQTNAHTLERLLPSICRGIRPHPGSSADQVSWGVTTPPERQTVLPTKSRALPQSGAHSTGTTPHRPAHASAALSTESSNHPCQWSHTLNDSEPACLVAACYLVRPCLRARGWAIFHSSQQGCLASSPSQQTAPVLNFRVLKP